MQVTLSNLTPNPEAFIAYIARVSNPDNQDNPEYAKLIRYLIKNKHWSPFEHAHMTVQIKTSRAIAAQILRHRSFSFQEFSQRYSEATEFEYIELRKQAIRNRQSSLETFDPLIESYNDAPVKASDLIEMVLDNALWAYKQLINAGVAKEVARMILPLTTQTTIFMTGNVRSWIHYIELRADEHTQKEHRDVAEQVKALFLVNFPFVSEALGWNNEFTTA